MMVLACIGCFVLGGIVGVFVMGLCVASSNNNVVTLWIVAIVLIIKLVTM